MCRELAARAAAERRDAAGGEREQAEDEREPEEAAAARAADDAAGRREHRGRRGVPTLGRVDRHRPDLRRLRLRRRGLRAGIPLLEADLRKLRLRRAVARLRRDQRQDAGVVAALLLDLSA